MIEFRSISKAFGKQSVLRNLNLEIRPGERLGITGRSGAGKSVLLKLATGLLHPDTGSIWIDGKDTRGFHHQQWERILEKMGFVFQAAALFDSMSIGENVGLKLSESGKFTSLQIRSAVTDALSSVGLDETILNKYPAEISGGMQKRVGVARAIVHKPEYVFFDEPTTGLDPLTAGKIDQLILELSISAGITPIMVTHDLETLKQVAQRIVLLEDGQIVFDGKTAGFFHSENPAVVQFLSRN